MIKDSIRLPKTMLGQEPLCMAVIGQGPGWLALNKPNAVALDPEEAEEGQFPFSITKVMNEQIKAKRPSIHAWNLQCAKSIYKLDPEISGGILIGTDAQASADLRNQYGSEGMIFHFKFLTRRQVADNELICDLPIASHHLENRKIVSHTTGKKTWTLFKRLETIGPFSLWEAQVKYIRPHQIRLHAAEMGIPMIGEDVYAEEKQVYLSELKFLNKRPEIEEPICPGLVLHLETVQFGIEKKNEIQKIEDKDNAKNFITFTAALRPKFQVLLNKLKDKYGSNKK